MQLSRLNPFNSLFGRVFIWFWTALLVIVLSSFFLAKQLTDVLEVNAVSQGQESETALMMQRLISVVERSNNLNQSLRRLGHRNGLHIVAINRNTGKRNTSFPTPVSRNIDELNAFVESDSPLLIRLNNMEFIGPYTLVFNLSEYSIFIGRLLLRSERDVVSRSKVTIAGLVLAIFLSTGFCFGLVLSITKPLGALRLASNRLARGDLSTRIEGLENRKDEVGNLAEDFNTMAVRLQSLIDSQKQLMANVSHELRTPLTRLQLAVALLEDQINTQSDGALSNADTKHLSRIENEIVKMDQMIGQVLTLAKINASQQPIDLQKMTLFSVLDGVLQDARFEASAMNKEFIVGPIPDISINANMPLLISAIENIVRNAIRFAAKEVSCELNIVSTSSATDFVEIVINDDGAGMSATDLKTVFDPFFRGSYQVHEVSKGAGLGLSIAKAAIETHGGSLFAYVHHAQVRFDRDQSQPGDNAQCERSVEEKSPLTGLSVIIRLPIASKPT
ncbi:MAG: two-component system sensor histidine kinase CpxA [Gammaproteobacteria bacterium]|jgi:two-component system sensor histidine kinase CpxA